jgi:DNA-3-methyladenine glycosylase II
MDRHPVHFRRRRQSSGHHGSVSPSFTVVLSGPLDIGASLEPYRRSGDDHIDRWDGARLLRTSVALGRVAAWSAAPVGNPAAPALAVTASVPEGEGAALSAAIRATFLKTPASWPVLLARDPVIADLDARFPGLRPVLQPDLLTALVRSISAQQVNLAWAATTRRRLAEAFGDRHAICGEVVYRLSAFRLADASVESIRALQFTTAKARSIVGVARAIADGAVNGTDLGDQPDERVIERLVELRGIGVWSAEWILARTFGRPRVVAGDLGVRKAVGRAYLGVPIASEAEVRRSTAHWGESGAVAQALLLRTLVP